MGLLEAIVGFRGEYFVNSARKCVGWIYEDWSSCGQIRTFWWFFWIFLEKNKKNNEKTGFPWKSGPNLMSFAFNRGGRGWTDKKYVWTNFNSPSAGDGWIVQKKKNIHPWFSCSRTVPIQICAAQILFLSLCPRATLLQLQFNSLVLL